MIHWSNELKKLKKEIGEGYIKSNVNNGDNKKIILGWQTEQKIVLEPNTSNADSTIKNTLGNLNIEAKAANKQVSINSNNSVILRSTSANIDLLPNGFIHCGSKQIKNVARPTEDNDAATKSYVDGGKVLRVINKANITITRINNIGASDTNGMYCKITFNNAEDRTFINAAARARKDISFYFAWDNVHLHKLSNISFFESSSALGGVCFAHLPAFWDNNKLTDFFNKGFTKFEILTIGV